MLITIEIKHCAFVCSTTTLSFYVATIKIDAFFWSVYECINTILEEPCIKSIVFQSIVLGPKKMTFSDKLTYGWIYGQLISEYQVWQQDHKLFWIQFCWQHCMFWIFDWQIFQKLIFAYNRIYRNFIQGNHKYKHLFTRLNPSYGCLVMDKGNPSTFQYQTVIHVCHWI